MDADDRTLTLGFRTLFFNDELAKAFHSGTKQAIILGAGLDTKVLKYVYPGRLLIEVDKAAVLDYKVRRLAAAGWRTYPSTLIKGDYLEIDLFKELEKAGLDFNKPVVIVWEGNCMYMPLSTSKGIVK